MNFKSDVNIKIGEIGKIVFKTELELEQQNKRGFSAKSESTKLLLEYSRKSGENPVSMSIIFSRKFDSKDIEFINTHGELFISSENIPTTFPLSFVNGVEQDKYEFRTPLSENFITFSELQHCEVLIELKKESSRKIEGTMKLEFNKELF